MKAQGLTPPPEDAEVSFWVPGGGDWSSTEIDIDEDNPVHIKWTEEEGSDD